VRRRVSVGFRLRADQNPSAARRAFF